MLATGRLDLNAIDALMKRLPYTIRRAIRSSNRKTKSYPLKQSYASQRQVLYEQNTLDTLTALLLITIIEIRQYKKKRCCHSEQLAFKLFYRLFTIKYPINSRNDLAITIDKTLCLAANEFQIPFVQNEEENGVHEAIAIKADYFGKLYSIDVADGIFEILDRFSKKVAANSAAHFAQTKALTALQELPSWDLEKIYTSYSSK